MKRFIVIFVVLVALLSCVLLLWHANGQSAGTIQLYNWLPADKLVEYNVAGMKKYISECSIIAEIDRVDMTYERSLDTETKLTRVFHVKNAIKGDVLPGACFYDELYLEENVAAAGVTTTRYEGKYWLLLKADCIVSGAEGKTCIDRSEAYIYSYFVFGGAMQALIENAS